jgi:dihydroflavonol-4-reductase
MRVFITGGNGFIGSRVVRALTEAGHDVRCLLRPTSNTDRIDDLQFESHIGDIRDLDSIRAGMDGMDACIHLASISAWSDMRSSALDDTVIAGTRNVLDCCLDHSPMRLIYVSSAIAINGSAAPRVFDEASPFELRDASMPYALAKHEAELLVTNYVKKGLDAVMVNPAEVYGPNDTGFVTAGNLVDALTSWPALACHGGTAVTHVDDVAQAMVSALTLGRSGERYILGGDNLSVSELLRLTIKLAGQSKPVMTLPNGPLKWAVNSLAKLRLPTPVAPEVLDYATYYFFMDSSKAKRELNYTPRPAAEVLMPVIGWLRSIGKV